MRSIPVSLPQAPSISARLLHAVQSQFVINQGLRFWARRLIWIDMRLNQACTARWKEGFDAAAFTLPRLHH
jgi:hypothetical protein